MKPTAAERRYFAYVDSLPCSHCRTTVRVTHHHIIGIGMGIMGDKAPHFAIMPLCSRCHADVHHDIEAWQMAQARWLIRTLDRAFKDGAIKYDTPRNT